MNFLEEKVADYLRTMADRFDEPVLLEMEALAKEKGFPIVGRNVGAMLELLARATNAIRVFEMGSGFGFSAYWLARGVGPDGEIILTDGDAENAKAAEDFLTKAGLWDRCSFVVGDALETLDGTDGDFDIIYCDIDKGDYPKAFAKAKERLKVGGLYACDNVLWSGRVASDDDDEWTEAIREQNRNIYADAAFLPIIVPIRDGVVVALKIA
jgi:predicted O-methyltransferase YrrM